MDALRPEDPRTIGRYTLSARLGAGGMGQVFLGWSPGGRPVAVKVVHPGFATDAEFRRRFKREVEAARQVGGFHTAPVVDADPDAETPWLVTAYVPGPSLAAVVAEHGPLPPASVLALGAGLAEALEAIHSVGVVHRDLKPSNILLAPDGPRVIDFGIARAVDASGITVRAGTPGFMAPELISEGSVTAACDVFALGAVLAHALGVRPFGEGPVEALTYRVVHKSPVLDGLPAPLRGVIDGCLARDPADRPEPAALLRTMSSASETGDWLPRPVQDMLTRYPVTGPPTPPQPITGTRPFEDGREQPAPWPAHDRSVTSVQFKASIAPAALALVGHAGRAVLGIVLGILSVTTVAVSAGGEGGTRFALVAAVLVVVSIWLVRTSVGAIAPDVSALVKPCELRVGAGGIELEHGGRQVLYHWHEVGRVVVRRAERVGWAVCVFPQPGTPLPSPRGPRTPLGYLERKTGWIMVVPVHRLKGSRKEIEMTLARYAGRLWGGNA
ncbi:serine/threonine-protein kinase [Actinomadura sp. WMMB 499]|uniref:serine/threonine-protein kinase n=1 Tax=Actinomadura sp. WMMB 499 TaxID=1219491 RepID=UPI001C3FA77B|nr:serine/threonine-protein kinase [Actinomadura sp. WMMB 499]